MHRMSDDSIDSEPTNRPSFIDINAHFASTLVYSI